VERQDLCRIVERVRAEIADESLHNRFILVRRPSLSVVGREFRKVRAHLLWRQVAIGIKNHDADRVGTEYFGLAAILALNGG
jgi:hypothetical protein